MTRNICIVTGSRAEYGLLKPLISKFSSCEKTNLQLIVTGTHLSKFHGYTVEEIEADNFPITAKVDLNLSEQENIPKAIATAINKFSDLLPQLQPNIVIVLGDRYEIFAVATVATVLNLPMAHIHGGETTEGSWDEAFRHSITKMSHLHFVSAKDYERRVIQLGENPSSVFDVGALGVENIFNTTLLSKSSLESLLNFSFGEKNIIVTFHSATLDLDNSLKDFSNLLNVLEKHKSLKIIFTKSNGDKGGLLINKMIDDFVALNENSVSFHSLGSLKYLSVMKFCDAVVGNSSSGIIEAPAMKVPTVNIGNRQTGRAFGNSVINCSGEEKEIDVALNKAFLMDKNSIQNIYGSGNTSTQIFEIINKKLDDKIDIKKKFYDIGETYE